MVRSIPLLDEQMSLKLLVDIIHSKNEENWQERNKAAFAELFEAPNGRYGKRAEKDLALRAPEMSSESGVPFAAYIHPSNPKSGPYSGLSFVIFPVENEACLVGLGVGTQGLSPDEVILGRPGHARKAQAICAWLNSEYGAGDQIAWAKHDPTRTDTAVPDELRKKWPQYRSVFERYGREMYALFRPGENSKATTDAITALLDLMIEDRGHTPIAKYKEDFERIRSQWFKHLMPDLEKETVRTLLNDRKFVIIQGPPGTGKTRMATELLRDDYKKNGKTVQFHANTTYEAFVGGLAPLHSDDGVGLRFAPRPGFLMMAAHEARKSPAPYLLHIDEINRADLSKIMGEAIFLFEAKPDQPRSVEMQYDFGEPFHQTLALPGNLHVLGTMNSADRSIALVDVAIRRRFAFETLWPQMAVVEKFGSELMQSAFKQIVAIFIENASEDAFPLVPGHSYFLEKDDSNARKSLKVNLAPLLEEYLAQGYVTGFAEPIRSYIQWLRSL